MTPDSESRIPAAAGVTASAVSAPPPAPPRPSMVLRTKSGQHPAVVAYRNKLASIHEGQGAALDDLAAKIDQETEVLKTPVPPPIPPEEVDPNERETPLPASH